PARVREREGRGLGCLYGFRLDRAAPRHQGPRGAVQDGVVGGHVNHFERHEVGHRNPRSARPPELQTGRAHAYGQPAMHGTDPSAMLETTISHWIRVVGNGIEVFGILVIVIGIVWSTMRYLRRLSAEHSYDIYKIRIGRSLLLGLEVLVAADIVKTIALELNFQSLALLAGLECGLTFLSWSLVLEIEGQWPWQRKPAPMADIRISQHSTRLSTQERPGISIMTLSG